MFAQRFYYSNEVTTPIFIVILVFNIFYLIPGEALREFDFALIWFFSRANGIIYNTDYLL
jgi:hypothetical protein